MRFGTLNVRSLYRSGELTTVAWELLRYKLDFVGVQEVSRDKGDNVRAGDYKFFCEKENENQQLETEYLHDRIISAVQRVGFASDRVSYVV